MQISDSLRSVGCVDHIPADGRIHRWKPDGHNKKTGWAVLHSDGSGVWGAAGDWRTGDKVTIKHGTVSREAVAAVQAKVDRRAKVSAANAKIKALMQWSRASALKAGDSAYLNNKEVMPFGLRHDGGTVLIPLSDSDGCLHGLQSISPEGRKLFTSGCIKKGKFHRIPGRGELVIAEGYATAASVHMATGMECIVAFDAGNLLPVALEMWRKDKHRQIIIAADNDSVGRESAIRAAQAVGGRAIWPAKEKSDYNDLHVAKGLTAVANSIYGAI
jgi:putative DNA primase/helicase